MDDKNKDNNSNSSPSAKQQISERIKDVSNILVTVSSNPTVDELSAALGLTLMLNKLDKHATAVFSGAVPPAIEFLEPDKTLENNVDSLRDFIIAIDKEKADRLRYKVEGDVVRIFITPYRTHITEQDLEFTHGDFNVELVLALGVENQDVLDQAITAHGKILHDATVATINAQTKTSTLGSIDWRDENASSLCEMLVSLGESLKAGLLDEQIATALLTGIVAATNRFSNDQTSSKSMTIAAQLMAAGANQQLVAAKLESASEISSKETDAKAEGDSPTKLDEGDIGKVRSKDTSDKSLGQIQIAHGTPKTIEEHDKINKQNAGEEALDAALEKLGTTPQKTEDLHAELETATAITTPEETQKSALIGKSKPAGKWNDPNLEEPSMGGSLSATTESAAEDQHHEEETNRNKTILSHDSPSASSKAKDARTPSVMDLQVTALEPKAGTLADIEAGVGAQHGQTENSDHVSNARQVVESAFGQTTSGLDTGDISLPAVPTPPMPDFSTLPPLPPTVPTPLETSPVVPTTIPPPQTAPTATEPGQFKIPGS